MMNEKYAMMLAIRHEYEEKVKSEWNKQSFADYLLNELAELRTPHNMNAIDIEYAALLIKTMPTDQAIQKLKAMLSGQPETTAIDGHLLVTYYKDRFASTDQTSQTILDIQNLCKSELAQMDVEKMDKHHRNEAKEKFIKKVLKLTKTKQT